MALTNLSKMFNLSGKLFWKQPLRWVVENVVLKIQAKSLKNICEGFFLLVKFHAKNWKPLLKIIFQNTSLQLILVFLASETLYQIYGSNTLKRLIFAEINFRELNFHVVLVSQMSILSYFMWIYFRG